LISQFHRGWAADEGWWATFIAGFRPFTSDLSNTLEGDRGGFYLGEYGVESDHDLGQRESFCKELHERSSEGPEAAWRFRHRHVSGVEFPRQRSDICACIVERRPREEATVSFIKEVTHT